MFEQLGLIGCGLMGGSFALAMKKAGLVKRVVGYSKSPTTTDTARRMGVIDVEAASALMAVSGSDIVLIAVPVAETEKAFKFIVAGLSSDVLVMDVGSTKTDVVAAARRTLRETHGCFVPCHPICGKEVSGIAHADGNLYAGAQVVITPTERTLMKQLKLAQTVWEKLGCAVRQMSPQVHDAGYAAVSHFPHLMAYALMNSIGAQAQSAQLLSLSGPGFRDTTRIAASDPNLWRDVLLANKDAVRKQSLLFRAALDALETCIANDDAPGLAAQITQARSLRLQLNAEQRTAAKAAT